jgi:hypothetical protein
MAPFVPNSRRRAQGARPPVQSAPDARKATRKNEQLIAKVPQRAAPVTTGRTILAFDPGGSTGVALRLPDGTWETNTLTDPGDIWDFINERPDVVVFEVFSTGGRVDKYMIYTIELVGGIKAVCYALSIRAIAHAPVKRYPFLQQAEALLKGQAHTRHEVDALAHLLAFEARG